MTWLFYLSINYFTVSSYIILYLVDNDHRVTVKTSYVKYIKFYFKIGASGVLWTIVSCESLRLFSSASFRFRLTGKRYDGTFCQLFVLI